MTGAPVPIRKGVRIARTNRPEDAMAIRFRSTFGTVDELEAVDASEWQKAALLLTVPCFNLRCLHGTLDARRDLALRLAELEIARHESKAYWARVGRDRILNGRESAEAMYGENDRLFERYRQATMDLARTPALSRLDLSTKRRAIGSVWLKAEGSWYDQLRAAVAADEERLTGYRAGVGK